jgi:hypothetical protein
VPGEWHLTELILNGTIIPINGYIIDFHVHPLDLWLSKISFRLSPYTIRALADVHTSTCTCSSPRCYFESLISSIKFTTWRLALDIHEGQNRGKLRMCEPCVLVMWIRNLMGITPTPDLLHALLARRSWWEKEEKRRIESSFICDSRIVTFAEKQVPTLHGSPL